MTGYLAWLIGVQESDIKAYRDTSDWPTHWAFKAQHHMSSLGITTEREALSVYRTQLIYG